MTHVLPESLIIGCASCGERADMLMPRFPAVAVRVEARRGTTRLSGRGRALLAALCDATPDVVVLSALLSEQDGLRVLRALRAAGCHAAVTFERRRGGRVRAAAPVVAVVEPQADDPHSADGSRAADAESADVPRERDDDAPLRARFGLSARECAVARLVAEGRTNREIAAALDLSPFTARNHTSRVLQKLGAKNRARVGVVLGG